MLISDLLDPIGVTLADPGFDTWEQADAIDAVNEAIEIVCSIDPGAYRETANVDLIAGIVQTIPADAEMLLSLDYNTGADGLTIDRVCRYTTKKEKDANNISWTTASATLVVREYMYDPKVDQSTYFVNPPMSGATKCMATVSKVPTAVTASGDTFPLARTYRTPVIELALYRLFTRDSEETDNFRRGQSHFEKGIQLLQARLSVRSVVEIEQVDEN